MRARLFLKSYQGVTLGKGTAEQSSSKTRPDPLWNSMLLSYQPNFWKEFQTKHWLPRVPTVIRQPFKEFPFSEELALRAMKRVEEGLQGGDRRLDVMVAVGDKMKDPKRPLRQLFKQKSESLDELEAAAGKVFKKENFGVIITNCHASHPGVWEGVSAFLQDAREYLDFPVPRAFMDLFYGRYESSFTALHKDTQDIIAFVFRGEKRMLAWPFDYLMGKVEGLNSGDRYFNKRLDHVDHNKFRKDAVVLDAKAGDLIYWPGDYWHVAEPKSKKFSGMMSLGLLRPEISVKSSDVSEFRKRLLRENPSQDVSGVVNWEEAEPKLRWVTGFGFQIGGATEEKSSLTSKEALVVKTKGSVILWTTNKSELLVASGGHSITLPNDQDLLAFLEKLSRGESVTVTKGHKTDAKIFESYWSKTAQPKVRKVSGKNPMFWLAGWLNRVGAAVLKE